MQAGQTFVYCVGLVVERRKKHSEALAGAEATPCWTLVLVAVLAVTDSAALLLSVSSLVLL